jgi:hypothetical protein
MHNALRPHRLDEPNWISEDEAEVPAYVTISLDDMDLGDFYIRSFTDLHASIDTATGKVDHCIRAHNYAKIPPAIIDLIDYWLTTPDGERRLQDAIDAEMECR